MKGDEPCCVDMHNELLAGRRPKIGWSQCPFCGSIVWVIPKLVSIETVEHAKEPGREKMEALDE